MCCKRGSRVFTASVAGKKLQGCDFLHFDEDGKIDDFAVMVRPLSAAHALSEAMGAQFEKIAREPPSSEPDDRRRGHRRGNA